jgi:WD40 repeat protein
MDIQLNKPVYAYGYPAINKPRYPTRQAKFLSGIINKALPTDNNHNGYVIVFDLPAIGGISGSPVCDENGEVIGIYGLTYKSNENLTLGIPISTYQQYASIDRAKLPAPSSQPKINKRKARTIPQPDRSTNINFNLAYSFNGIDLLPVTPDSQTFETLFKNSNENNQRLSGSSSSVAISPNGQTFITGDSEGNLEVRHLQDGQVYQNLNSDKRLRLIRLITISPDGETLISGSVSDITITRLQDGKTLHHLYTKHKIITSIAISPNGETFITGGLDDKTIRVWGLRDGQLLRTFSSGHQDWVKALAISPDGQTFITGSLDNTIKVWRLQDGQLLRNLILDGNRLRSSNLRVNAIAISPDGKTLVSGSKAIKVWGLEDGKLLQTLNNYENVNVIAISPDGQTVFSGNEDNTIKVWRLQDGKLLSTLRGHQSTINSLVISPDGRTLVSGSSDRNIKVWQVSP